MGDLLFGHRDPLFGIIILILIIATIFIVTHIWNLRAQKHKEESLKRFARAFEYSGVDKEAQLLMGQGEHIPLALRYLAKTYEKAGEYDKSIKIYLAILEHPCELSEKLLLFESLGETYFRAGFLERSKKIFLEILKNMPRNSHVLFLLMQACEKLGQFDEALEALDCLLELGERHEEIMISYAYLSAKRLLGDSFISIKRRNSELLVWLAREPRLLRLILSYFKGFDMAVFWDLVGETPQVIEVADILWNLPREQISFETLNQNPALLELYRAKGYINDEVVCERFELEALRVINRHCAQKADLDFEYHCHACKGIFPVDFERCPSCAELLSGNLVLKIRKSRNEADFSFL
ncbi:MAG: tetratricopeptide repeat protein [Wolinella sp.]